MRSQVGGEDLGQIAPLSQEDDDECRRHHASTRFGLALDESLLLFGLSGFADGQAGAHQEHEGDDAVEHPVRHQVEEDAADGGGHGDVDDEGSGCPEPDEERFAPRRQDKRGEHCLVGQLAEEDDREDGDDDGEVHGDLSRRNEETSFVPANYDLARTKVSPTCTQVR